MSKKSFDDSHISMSAQSLPELTEGQKACLRLVEQQHTSKEIARKLGISRFTVDQRLDAARRKLNASSRKEAAKIFAALDVNRISEPLVYEAFVLDSKHQIANQSSRSGRWKWGLSRILSLRSSVALGGEGPEITSREILVRALNIAFFSTLVLAMVLTSFLVVILSGTF